MRPPRQVVVASPLKISFSVVIISDLPNRRGRARKTQEQPDVTSRCKYAVLYTLQDEIIDARLGVVKALLRTSGRTIKEIADACEFGSPTALMLLFKKRTGLSCGDYRHGGTSRGQTGMALG